MNNHLIKKLENEFILLGSIERCEKVITRILHQYLTNFPGFTDHSIEHSKRVLKYASELLKEEVEKLNNQEVYILVMACYLHDIGMCASKPIKDKLRKDLKFSTFLKQNKDKNLNDYIREIHHHLSYQFILDNWKKINILDVRYAKAIAIVSKGHRQEELMNEDLFYPKYPVKSGSDFVCLPFLAAILRLADELDITNDRTPELLFDNYLPENKISKKEWIKHRDTYSVNFDTDENKIIITATCDNPQIYENMSKRNRKINETLSYLHKIIRHLPLRTRTLGIGFNKIESNIDTKGFIPKNIRFGLDSESTIETLLGEKLYSNRMVAIREALQNAIDTCRYKKKLLASYIPQIRVVLKGNELSIEDNGMGMDEYIVENFFAKLGSCFYKQKNVSKKFEAISEFGIGVFSYFLLCNYFDVETKFENKDPLKFRVLKDPDSPFHFFDDIKRAATGTKLTLFLKQNLTFEKLKETIKHYVRFVEIPIIIQSESRKEIIEKQSLKISVKQELSKRIHLLHGEQIKKLTLLTTKLENEDYLGYCSLILEKNELKNYIPVHLYKIIDESKNIISISQKGIFVFDAGTYQLSLKNFFGNINIKTKKELSLGRDWLLDKVALNEIISDFVADVIQKLFCSWKTLNSKKQAELTRDFIDNYIVIRAKEDIPGKLVSVITKYFFVEYYNNFKVKYTTLEKFLQANNKFMLLQSRPNYQGKYVFNNIEKIFNMFKIPILMVYDDLDDEFYLELFQSLPKEISIVSDHEKSFYVIHNKERRYNLRLLDDFWRHVLSIINDGWISTYPGITTTNPLNIKHPIVQFVIKNEKMIRLNQRLYDLFNIFFDELHDFIFNFHVTSVEKPKKSLKELNKILRFINRATHKTFKISRKDFPIWMQKKI